MTRSRVYAVRPQALGGQEVALIAGPGAHRVRRLTSAAWLVLFMAMMSQSTTAADEALKASKAELPRVEGAALLSRIQEAARHQNYAGTFVYQVGGQMQSSRITHLAEPGSELEKLEILDGKIREFIRHDDEVRCYIPDSKMLLIESRAKADKFPAFLTAAPTDVDLYYTVSRGGVERVAGHSCNVIELAPHDDLRFGYRLWSDQETGLLLKAQTLDEHGEVLEQVGFTDVSIGGRIEKGRIKPTVTSTDGWRVEKFHSVPVDLASEGWTLGSLPLGFRKITEVRRTMGAGREVGQMVFSDGLAAVSVFIEPLGGPNQTSGEARKGLINILAKEHGGHWLTVVGEVPAATIRQVADSLDFHPPK